jgi:hypothetical protein
LEAKGFPGFGMGSSSPALSGWRTDRPIASGKKRSVDMDRSVSNAVRNMSTEKNVPILVVLRMSTIGSLS